MDHSGDQPWPIFIETKEGRELPIELNRGDIMVYKGADLPHWREPFRDDWQAQAFLHFVRKGGPYESFRYDTRPRLGAPIESRSFKQGPVKMRLRDA